MSENANTIFTLLLYHYPLRCSFRFKSLFGWSRLLKSFIFVHLFEASFDADLDSIGILLHFFTQLVPYLQ